MFQRLRSKKALIIAAASLLALIVIGITIGSIVSHNSSDQAKNSAASAPDFEPILPQGKTIEELGGWQRLTPPNNAPYYVFTDSIDGVSITVSQQALPESFKANTAQSIQDLAKSYSATEELDVDSGKVYIGTSTKGPQSVIFTMNGLLVLIKSQATIENDAWVTYIASLGLKNTPRY